VLSKAVTKSLQIESATVGTPGTLPLAGCRVVALLSSIELFGQEKGNIEVFKTLRSAGADLQVGVSAIEDGGQVGAYLRELEFPTFRVPFGGQWSKTLFRRRPSLIAASLTNVLRSTAVMARKCKSFRPTHVHLGTATAYSYVAPALSRYYVPMVFRVGDEPPLQSRPNLWLWRRCVARANAVIANCDFIRNRILDASPTALPKLHRIFNLAPSARSIPNVMRSATEKQHVVFVGQLAEHKGIVPFVDVAMSMVRQRSDVVFDIVGGSRSSGDLERSLRARVDQAGLQHGIRFHGYVQDPSSYFRTAAVHVAPSLFEDPSANVVLEAKRLGTPSVVFPSGGLRELVRHHVDGFVCREKTAAALTEGIRWFLDWPQRLSAARAAALEDHHERFGAARFSAQWIQVYSGSSGLTPTETSVMDA
jgi:glycosyltransferase involved in cell wall biosynthesis